jgi:transposase
MAKTDRIDSKIIAEYGFQSDLPSYQTVTPELTRLKELAKFYIQNQKDLTRLKNRNRIKQDPFVRKARGKQILFISRSMDATIEEMESICNESEHLSLICNCLRKQKGIGLKTSMLLIALLPELGQINGKKIASLAGLAPFAHDSGRIKGKRYIQGGRFDVRKLLYMPVLSAIRMDMEFKRLYEDRLSKGKAKKVAITSLMRKLLVRLNARIRDLLTEESMQSFCV